MNEDRVAGTTKESWRWTRSSLLRRHDLPIRSPFVLILVHV